MEFPFSWRCRRHLVRGLCSSSTRRRTARGESRRVGVSQPPRVDPRHRPGPWKSAADELRELAQRPGQTAGSIGDDDQAQDLDVRHDARGPLRGGGLRCTQATHVRPRGEDDPCGAPGPAAAAIRGLRRATRARGQPGSTPPLRRARPATTDRQVGPGRTRRAGRRDPGSERRAAAPPSRSAATPRSLSRPERRAPAPSAARATGCCHLTRRDSFPIMVLRVSLYHIMAPVAEGSNIMRYLSDRRRSCRIVAGSSIMGACDEQRGCAR